ncbi:MAG: hypothetical protein ACRD5L_12070, partial [Bryobacteraceae bacterium]
MVGSAAQLVAVACHFNGLVQGLRPNSFGLQNSTCQFCEYIHFARRHPDWFGRAARWTMAARTPGEWFAYEARQGRRAIINYQPAQNARISDRMSSAFVGGGGRWQLNLVEQKRMDVWEANWEVGNREAD